MGDEAREARLLAFFNDLSDVGKDAVLALMEKIGQGKITTALADVSLHKGIETAVADD
jgi:hypothetical protein